MFISKKKFKEEIAKAVKERENEIQNERRMEDEFRYIRNDMDDRFRWQREDFNHLADRVYKIEKTLGMHDEHGELCKISEVR